MTLNDQNHTSPEWLREHLPPPSSPPYLPPTNPPEPTEPTRRRNTVALGLGVLTALLLVALVTVTVVARTQHNKAVDTHAKLVATQGTLADTKRILEQTKTDLDETKADLDAAQADLANAKTDLLNTKSDLASSQEQVKACGFVAKIGNHLLTGLSLALESGTAGTNMQYGLALSLLDDLKAEMDAIYTIEDEAGFHKDLDGLVAACTGTVKGTING